MRSFDIAGISVAPGKRARAEIQVARLFDFTRMTVPLEVIRGKQDGPTLFVTAAIHGDEINGIEIIRRLLHARVFSHLRGTLIAVPIVNVFGFNTKQRYLPDRRDLNRCFPGSPDGSLASQLAHAIMTEVVLKSTHGIDLHTGAVHRSNLPHIRASLEQPQVQAMAEAFGAPLIINSGMRDGSLRAASREHGIPTLLYEGGEALRFSEPVIRMGLRGILSVMQHIGMLPAAARDRTLTPSRIASGSFWVRAPHSGIMMSHTKLGDVIEAGQPLGVISDPFGRQRFEVVSKMPGIIVGMSQLPLLNEGDAVFHIAGQEPKGEMTTAEEAGMLSGHAETYVT